MSDCSYVDFKGRTFSSKDEEQAVSKELLNWGTHHEFMCVSTPYWILVAQPLGTEGLCCDRSHTCDTPSTCVWLCSTPCMAQVQETSLLQADCCTT